MKRITLPMMMLVISGAVLAQEPPTPPRARPAPPAVEARPAPEPRPAPVAVPMTRVYGPDGEFYLPRVDVESVRERAREASAMATIEAREAMRIDVDRIREQAVQATEMARPYIMDATRALVGPIAAYAAGAVGTTIIGDRLDGRRPPQSWAPGDPADSLYRAARDVLNRGDWGRAARMFADIQKNYSKSVYVNESQYWEAYARYKIGTTDELRRAAQLLEPLAAKASPSGSTPGATTVRYTNFDGMRRTSDNDVLSLYARINGALALRGDRDAAAKVEKAASTPGAPCDQEDIQVRSEALNALSQIDPAQALPILRKVIDRKDDCSASLRRSAVFMLGRRGDAESSSLLMSVAKSEPNISVRTEAINFLSRVPGDAGVNALEEMLRNEQDERIQRAAVRALTASDNQRARSSMRALIDRRDAPLNLRIEAINAFNSERATADDAAYLRGLYAKADNDQVKGAIVDAVGRIGGSENEQWVLGIARNSNESSSMRSRALSRFMRSSTISVGDLVKLYDSAAESYEIRQRIISMLGQRKEPEATDKLIDIVRTSTVMNHRTQAINALVNKKDPRAQQALMDVLDGKKP